MGGAYYRRVFCVSNLRGLFSEFYGIKGKKISITIPRRLHRVYLGLSNHCNANTQFSFLAATEVFGNRVQLVRQVNLLWHRVDLHTSWREKDQCTNGKDLTKSTTSNLRQNLLKFSLSLGQSPYFTWAELNCLSSAHVRYGVWPS